MKQSLFADAVYSGCAVTTSESLYKDQLKDRGCEVIRAHGDADVDIVKAATASAKRRDTTLVGEDTDLLILLLHYAEREIAQGRSRRSGRGLTTFSATNFYYSLLFKVTAHHPPHPITTAVRHYMTGPLFKSRLRPCNNNCLKPLAVLIVCRNSYLLLSLLYYYRN